jgi:hypothetical protein
MILRTKGGYFPEQDKPTDPCDGKQLTHVFIEKCASSWRTLFTLCVHTFKGPEFVSALFSYTLSFTS